MHMREEQTINSYPRKEIAIQNLRRIRRLSSSAYAVARCDH
jgi:hypothetical protein